LDLSGNKFWIFYNKCNIRFPAQIYLLFSSDLRRRPVLVAHHEVRRLRRHRQGAHFIRLGQKIFGQIFSPDFSTTLHHKITDLNTPDSNTQAKGFNTTKK
jgi:hypothetical protein